MNGFPFKSPPEIMRELAERVKTRRIQLTISQRELAERSGVSFGSVKRFEQTGEISLKHLLHIAIVLRATDDFDELFKEIEYTSIDELIRRKETVATKRTRVRKHKA